MHGGRPARGYAVDRAALREPAFERRRALCRRASERMRSTLKSSATRAMSRARAPTPSERGRKIRGRAPASQDVHPIALRVVPRSGYRPWMTSHHESCIARPRVALRRACTARPASTGAPSQRGNAVSASIGRPRRRVRSRSTATGSAFGTAPDVARAVASDVRQRPVRRAAPASRRDGRSAARPGVRARSGSRARAPGGGGGGRASTGSRAASRRRAPRRARGARR